jgi:Holliday junction DNA helicase RuvB
MDREILSAIIQKFDGGPVGLNNLGVAVGEESQTIEEVHEPFLIHQGFVKRTPAGRVATSLAYKHLKLIPSQGAQKRLF